ncbi:MAG TPA: hypothetical protein VEA36_01435 [Candidatus Paceibacterota bacterium]|nr:hypothetical protein [Candidatus Paceibacterota bacterium]
MAETQTAGMRRTTDHDRIERWAEERQGTPAIIESTWDGNTAVLQIDFGDPDESLMEITWDEFFRIFDDAELEFIYEEYTEDGGASRRYDITERS